MAKIQLLPSGVFSWGRSAAKAPGSNLFFRQNSMELSFAPSTTNTEDSLTTHMLRVGCQLDAQALQLRFNPFALQVFR